MVEAKTFLNCKAAVSMIQEEFGETNSIVKFVNEEAGRLILVLEDMIQIILKSTDINSVSIRELKERTIDAKGHLHNLRDKLINPQVSLPKETFDLCKKELGMYNDEYMDDVVTTWILNGSRETVMDRLYSACYRMRELIRKVQ